MISAHYPTKKALKEAVAAGNVTKGSLRFQETSLHGYEWKDDGYFNVVGPDAYTNRKWYATVYTEKGKVVKVK